MSTDNDTTNPLVLIPGGTTTVADSPSWLTTAAEHVLTRSSSCLALITPEGACPQCGREVPGIWDPAGPPPAVGQWWPRRVAVGA